MFVSIDLQNARVLHKHASMQVVADLVWLEAPEFSILITSFASPTLQTWTIAELNKLYKNLTGEKFNGFEEAKLRLTIAAAISKLPVTDCDAAELAAQCAKIKAKDGRAYRYVRGAKTPAVREGDIVPLMITGAVDEAFEYFNDPEVISNYQRDATVSTSTKPRMKIAPQAPRRPKDGIALEIWDYLDANPHYDAKMLQALSVEKNWNLLTLIMNFSQWKNFKEFT